jgi:hypothetical protein
MGRGIDDAAVHPRINEKTADTLLESLANVLASLDCLKLMHASNVFGRGIGLKKLELIAEALPAIISQMDDFRPSRSWWSSRESNRGRRNNSWPAWALSSRSWMITKFRVTALPPCQQSTMTCR